jgi:hypothetical protein
MPRTGRYDVDEMGFVPRRRAAMQHQAPAEEEAAAAVPARQVEVRLIEAKWKPGKNGFQFTEQCQLEIKAEYVITTVRTRVEIRPFVVFNGQEEDLGSPTEAFLDNNGIAVATILLEYGSAYYDALEKDPSVTCRYKCRLSHSTGEREIESELLDMPQGTQPAPKGVFKVRLDIDPAKADADEDAFILFSTDPTASYSKTLTVKDDKIKGDAFLDLEFVDLVEGLNYSLKVLPGNKNKGYLLFTDKPYRELL